MSILGQLLLVGHRSNPAPVDTRAPYRAFVESREVFVPTGGAGQKDNILTEPRSPRPLFVLDVGRWSGTGAKECS